MKNAPLAKITRPKLSGIFGRDRLFRLIDRGRSKPVVWVAAQAGSGKTTLVASYLDSRKLPCLWYQVDQGDGDIASFFYYMGMAAKKAAPRYKKPLPLLTPEYLMGVPVFTRRYFEELFRRLKPPAVIVLDNYQAAPLDSGFHDMLVHGLDAVPEGITVLVLSRTGLPPQLARLLANNRLQLIGGDDVRFTRKESGELLKTQCQGRPDKKTVALLHEKTAGWAAGLVLLMAGAGSSGPDVRAFGDKTPGGLFDYFASEIFDKTDEAAQNVLLKTSFLQRIEPADAEQLTGNGMAGKILERLSRHHYFTEKYDRTYQYHPLFREFLQSRARNTFTQADVAGIQGNAAGFLEKSGRFDEAIGLFIEGSDWGGVERVLLGRAEELVSQGRNKTLEEWITAVPDELRNNNPWLLYWLSICSLPLDPAKSRRLSEQSFLLFDTQQSETGAFLSWAAAIQSTFHEWDDFDKIDPLITWLDKRMQNNAAFPSLEIEALVATGMIGALLWRRRTYSEFKKWTDRALTLARASGNCNLRLQAGINAVQFYILTGDFANGRLQSEELARAAQAPNVSPLMKVLCKSIEGFVKMMTMSSEDPLKTVLEGLEAAEKSGIHMWDHMLFAQGACVSLNTGDTTSAGIYLGKMQASLIGPKSFGRFHYHLLSGWYCLLNDEIKTAQAHAENALKYLLESKAFNVEALFSVHSELAQIFHEQAEYGKASDHMMRAHDFVRTSGSSILEYMYLMSVAQFAFDRDEQQQGLESLQKAMALGRQQDYMGMFWWWRPTVMSRLCAKALEQGIETDYVGKLIAKRGLVPEQPVENWPYSVRIHTLGRFSIEINNKPLVFSGKVQKKPLELLKALISLGGENVTEEKIAEALWPDADGDRAHASFEAALHRLRQLIGDKVLLFQDKLLSLDKRCCWVDVWDFEGRIKPVETSREPETLQRGETAFALYEGHFLPADNEAQWSVTMRERLRDKFIRLAVSLGGYWEERGDWEKALGYFQKGLEIDGLAEELYQRAMTCQVELGRHAQAAATYNHCKAALARAFGVSPSRRTEEIHASIRKE